MKHTSTLAVTLFLSLGFLSASAKADTVYITLDHSTQQVTAGVTTIDFMATIITDPSNAGPTYLNGDSFSVDGPLSVDDSSFALVPYPIDPNTYLDTVLFTIDLPGNEPLGSYFGVFNITGGSDGNASDTLATLTFEVDNVSGSGPLSPIPEPPSLLLLGTGLAALAAAFRMRQKLANAHRHLMTC